MKLINIVRDFSFPPKRERCGIRVIHGAPGFLGARTEESGVLPIQGGAEAAPPPMQFGKASVFWELFRTLAEDMQGGVAPAAKRIHH